MKNRAELVTGVTPLGLLLLLLPTLLASFPSAAAPEGPGGDPAMEILGARSSLLPSREQLAAKLAELEAATELDETARAALTELYHRTQSSLEEAEHFDTKAAEYGRFLQSAPQLIATIQRQLEQEESVATERPEPLPDGLSSEEISQRLSKLLADMAVEETRVSEFEKRFDASADRPAAARARLIEVKQILDELDQDLEQLPLAGDSPELSRARRWALEARRTAAWAEGRMLDQELLTQPSRVELYRAKRDQAAEALKDLRARQRVLEELQSQRRKADAAAAQEATERADREAEDKHPLVRELTGENVTITEALGQLAKRLDGLGDELARIESERERLEEDYRGARQRLAAVGLSKALGQLLLDRRNQLPDQRYYRNAIEAREDQIAEATLRQIRHREERRHLGDLDQYLDELTHNEPSARIPLVRDQLLEVLAQRKRLLAQALSVENDYIRQLGELNYASEQVVRIADNYDDFLSQRLLWVRSAPAVNMETLQALPSALAWIISREDWIEVLEVFTERVRHSFFFWSGTLILAALFWRLSTLRRAIRAMAEPLRRVRTDRIRFTLQAIALTLLAASPLPLLLWLSGQLLLSAADANGLARPLGAALTEVSFGLYFLLAFRMLCIRGGVADRHFRWRTETLARIRQEFDWFALYVVPVSAIAIAVYHHNDPVYVGSLGRLTLVASMLGFAVFFARLLSPAKGVLKGRLAAQPEGWLSRSRHLWYPFVVGSPLALAALALLGYIYTAGTLFESLVNETWLVLVLVVLHQSIVRWLILTRRRLVLQAALERQAARRAQATAERTESGGGSELLPVEEPEPDLAALDEQTRRLINASIFVAAVIGLWITWSDVLPAFTQLERFALWHYKGLVDGTEQLIPVTAADVGLVLVILFVATIAAKNLPALLEILLLQSPSVSAGARYAITTLSSYLITAAAFLLAFSTLGLSWSQVQWLVAALSVGIGFGLQEIVANFISGIIILFERPVRVGDIVTIGDTTGVVTNIRIRATTIRNWDKQELLVPNKEFITGRLLNWTLTDQHNRITIPVGIEYGSDTDRALALLAEVAARDERVLTDPAPLISFEGFGDNALTLVLRCYLDSLDGRIGVITDLHQAIYKTFAENGIQMAFPQRDVRLWARNPLDVRIQRATHPDPSAETPEAGGLTPTSHT